MTSINNSVPAMASYYASQASAQSTATKGSTTSGEQSTNDPVAELRRFAKQIVAQSEGGLLRALNSGGNKQSSTLQSILGSNASTSGSSAAASGIRLPDVASLDRDEAAKLLEQVQKLADAGLNESISFSGSNNGKQTDSLETYRQWLQDKGGISVYV